MRLTVIGCSGSYPGPDSAGQLLPARGRRRRPHLADPARPRQRRARARCSATPTPRADRRGLPQPPARRPLPRPLRLLRAAQVPPRRRPAAHPGLGPGRHRPPDGQGLRPDEDPGMTEEFDFLELRRRRSSSARSRSTRCEVVPPGARPTRLRVDGRRPLARLLRRHRCLRTASTTPPRGADLLLCEASFLRRRRRTRPTCTSPARRPARWPPRHGARRLVLTHIPPWHDPQVVLREAGPAATTVRASWPPAGPRRRLSERGAARSGTSRTSPWSGRRRGRRSRSAPGW